jgi:hypothetical protein
VGGIHQFRWCSHRTGCVAWADAPVCMCGFLFFIMNERGVLSLGTPGGAAVDPAGDIRLFHHGGFRHSGGVVDENPLKRCLKGVIRCEWWISALQRGGGYMSLCRRGESHHKHLWKLGKKFFPLFPPFVEWEVGIRRYPCIFRQTCLSWKKQFSPPHRDFEHYTPRDGLKRMCLHG